MVRTRWFKDHDLWLFAPHPAPERAKAGSGVVELGMLSCLDPMHIQMRFGDVDPDAVFIIFDVLCLSCRASSCCVSVQASCEDGG